MHLVGASQSQKARICHHCILQTKRRCAGNDAREQALICQVRINQPYSLNHLSVVNAAPTDLYHTLWKQREQCLQTLSTSNNSCI